MWQQRSSWMSQWKNKGTTEELSKLRSTNSKIGQIIVIWMAQALVRCHSRLNINWSIKFWFFIIVIGISFFFFKSFSRTRSSQDTSPTSTCRAATCTKLRNRAVLPSFFPRLFCTTRLLRGRQGFYSSCACQHVRTCALVAFALASYGTLFQKLSLPLFLLIFASFVIILTHSLTTWHKASLQFF